MCRVLGVSTSGYYAARQRPRSARAEQDDALTQTIVNIHRNSRGTYGAPRVHAELRLEHGQRCSRKRVARLMRLAGLRGCHRRRTIHTTRRSPEASCRRAKFTQPTHSCDVSRRESVGRQASCPRHAL